MLRARSIMRRETGGEDVSGTLDQDDNLESIIARADGALDRRYHVTRDGAVVGELAMHDVMKALVPQISSGEGARRGV